MPHTHAYRSELSWEGSTASGYEVYERAHRVLIPPAEAELLLSSDPAFKGDGQLANPEQLLLAAASSCQLHVPRAGRALPHRHACLRAGWPRPA